VRRIATIDCGTNTILLLVAEVQGGRLVPVEERAEIVRLGEGLDASGRLKDEAIARTLAALDGYVARIEHHGAERVLAVGTEALRKAQNGRQLVDEARARLAQVGGTFEVIDGAREAALSWRAVADAFPTLARRTVVDIGGGSTEVLVGAARIEEVVSLPIGAVRLTERLLHHDPPTADETRALRDTIDAALAGAPAPVPPVVGIAGTVTTLSAMAQRLATYSAERVHGAELAVSELAALVDTLGVTPLAARKRLPGLEPKRADVIYAGALILERILARASADRCLVSDRGIRWGLAAEALASLA
jgi:exopolyphosphatase/guanosine-5'-triphosphate,3'-diphosphate pyrophosphatase